MRGSRRRGATYTPDCAAIHPARLVRGLAAAVERRGVTIHEQTRVTAIAPRRRAHRPRHGAGAAPCVRATEGFTPALPGHRRTSIPVYSLIIATEPLAAAVWDEIGLARRETFSDHRHLIVYGQRTADDRLVFGGRGAPYHLGSRIKPDFDRDEAVFARAPTRACVDLLPGPATASGCTHAWGGPLGVPRDWCASVGLDRGDRASPGPAGTSATGSPPPTSPAARCATWCSAATPSSPGCPGSTTARRGGSPSRCAGSASTPPCVAMTAADREESLTGRPSLVARAVAPLVS